MKLKFTMSDKTEVFIDSLDELKKNKGKYPQKSDQHFIGNLEFSGGGLNDDYIFINQKFIEKIEINESSAIIKLKIPSPLSNIEEYKDNILCNILGSWISGSEAWKVSDVKHNVIKDDLPKPINGDIGDWLTRPKRPLDIGPKKTPKIELSDAFPITNIGICDKDGGSRLENANIGFFVIRHINKVSFLAMAFIPYGSHDNNLDTADSYGGLRLAGLSSKKMTVKGFGEKWCSAPALLFISLGFEAFNSWQEPSRWKALIQWRPLGEGGKKPKKISFLSLNDFFGEVWNKITRNTETGLRIFQGGHPLAVMPIIQSKQSNDVPILLFEINNTGAANLKKLFFRAWNANEKNTDITFSWQSADTVLEEKTVTEIKPPYQIENSSLNLKGEYTSIDIVGWHDQNKDEDIPYIDSLNITILLQKTFESLVAEDNNSDSLAKWVFNVNLEQETDWITVGSLEIKPEKEKLASLTISLRGKWTADRCDIYPDIRLEGLPCLVRQSSNNDTSLGEFIATFDTVNRLEDNLHRETNPILKTDNEGAFEGNISIRMKCEPGRDSLTEWSLSSFDKKQQLKPAFYFQARPFTVANLHSPEFDEQAGELFAYWRSDDPEGPQWRLPNSTITFDLPPQAVGEEMERGNRFWKDNISYIDETKPLRYRFSPPARMTVKPSFKERRYNKNQNNLGQILRGAKVEAFTTEIVYPVRTEFKKDESVKSDVHIAETSSFLGQPSPNLPQKTENVSEIARDVLADELGSWLVSESVKDRKESFKGEYPKLRQRHSAARANFVSRLAQFHLFDPYKKYQALQLREGLKFEIRATDKGASPLWNPLPKGVDLLGDQKRNINLFLKKDNQGNPNWGEDPDCSLRAGIIHTIEFPSELVNVLRSPSSNQGVIDKLYFSALGAGGDVSMSFDEGRTTFIAETQHGQLSRLVKIRIGRIGVLWNKARHVIEYERTTVPSEQFYEEQKVSPKLGWPILRKMTEYVEPIEMVREFSSEASGAEKNSTGFIHASEFVTPRIYVNGAWGGDLGHGYEIPLWNPNDTTGFYPKPQAALQIYAGGQNRSRAWLSEPDHLYFYSNTEPNTGNDPDRWLAMRGIDCPFGPARLPVMTGQKLGGEEILSPSTLSPSLRATRRPRFDLATVTDGPANLQHGRGQSEILAPLETVSLARTLETSPLPSDSAEIKNKCLQKEMKVIGELNDFSRIASQIEANIQALITKIPQIILRYEFADCSELEKQLIKEININFENARKLVQDQLKNPPNYQWMPLTQLLGAELTGRLLYPLEPVKVAIQKFCDDLIKIRNVIDLEAHGEELRTSINATWNILYKELLFRSQENEANLIKSWKEISENAQLKGLPTDFQDLLKEIQKIPEKDRDEFVKACETLIDHLKKIQNKVRQIKEPKIGATIEKMAEALDHLIAGISSAKDTILSISEENKWKKIIKDTRDTSSNIAQSLYDVAIAIKKLLNSIFVDVESNKGEIHKAIDKLDNVFKEINNIFKQSWKPDPKEPQKIFNILVKITDLLSKSNTGLIDTYGNWLNAYKFIINKEISALDKNIEKLSSHVYSFCDVQRDYLKETLDSKESQVTKFVKEKMGNGCKNVHEFSRELLKELLPIKHQVESQFSKPVSAILDSVTQQHFESWDRSLKDYEDTAGKGLKLVKALGELPKLPQLTFNAERAEYVFDDIKKQIDTSPFAVKLKEIDGGLKELGLAIPTRQLMDQFVPEIPSQLEFGSIFKNIGGIDFDGLFPSFKLPQLGNDHIKVTHGLDKETRSAWVKSTVAFDEPEEKDFFSVLKIANLSIRASSDIVINADGSRRATTDSRFTGDWNLKLGKDSIVSFRQVTVKHDGSHFDFDISPDRVELHPKIKFISDLAKKIGDEIPPVIQLEKDERGIPVGARAALTTVINNPPQLGPLMIGPLSLSGGLGLRVRKDGQFDILTHFSVGSQNAPIFIQMGWLGGGFWLTSKAQMNPDVFSAEIGLSVGSMRAINLGSVARGAYSILFSVILVSKGDPTATFLMQGNARILGLANASVLLGLTATHENGETQGTGTLEVNIEICWCYSVHVVKTCNQKMSS